MPVVPTVHSDAAVRGANRGGVQDRSQEAKSSSVVQQLSRGLPQHETVPAEPANTITRHTNFQH